MLRLELGVDKRVVRTSAFLAGVELHAGVHVAHRPETTLVPELPRGRDTDLLEGAVEKRHVERGSVAPRAHVFYPAVLIQPAGELLQHLIDGLTAIGNRPPSFIALQQPPDHRTRVDLPAGCDCAAEVDRARERRPERLRVDVEKHGADRDERSVRRQAHRFKVNHQIEILFCHFLDLFFVSVKM